MMKKSKKVFAAVIALIMSVFAVVLVGCSKKDAKKPADTTYTVTYIANGGIFADKLTSRTEKVKKDGFALGNVIPTHPENLRFLGWGDSASAVTAVDLSTRPVTGNVTYYALWNGGAQPVEQYTVTFYYNYDGAPSGGVFDTKTVNAGQKVSAPASAPSRGADYTFDGWHTAPDGGSVYNFNTAVNGALNLYAHWTRTSAPVPELISVTASAPADKLTIVAGQSFDESSLTVVAHYNNGGADQTLAAGDYTIEYPADMTSAGVKTVTVRYNGMTDTITVTVIPRAVSSVTVGGNLANRRQEVGAKFDPSGLTFTAVYNDGSQEPIVVGHMYFMSDILDADGRFTQAAETAIVIAEYDGIVATPSISLEVVVPAVVRHDVEFDANNSAYESHISGMPEIERIDDGGKVSRPTAPALKGFTFGGWFTTASCDTEWDFTNDTVTDDITLYAKWTAKTYTVEYNYNGAASVATNPVSYTATAGEFEDFTLVAPVKDHNAFDGWFTTSLFQPSSKVAKLSYDILPQDSETIRLFAKFTPEVYTLSFEFGADNGIKYSAALKDGVSFPQNYTFGTTVTFPTADDIDITVLIDAAVEFNFLGWYLSGDDGKQYVNGVSATDFGDKTFVADIVQAATHTVTFDMNYTGSAPTSVHVLDGQTVNALSPAPTRPGYSFGGWYTAPACVTEFDFTEAVTADKTAYAKWTAIEYTVAYKNLPTGSVNTNNPIMYVVTDGDIPLTAPSSLPAGYRFNGWFFNSGLSVAATRLTPDDISRAQGNVITVYGAFSNKYTVSFNENVVGDTVTGMPSDMTVVYGDGIVRPAADPARVNYTFGGWYEDAACVTPWAFSGSASPTAVYGDVTVYAKWIENPDDGVYIYGDLNDFSMIPAGTVAEFQAAYKAAEQGGAYTVNGIALAVGDEFKFIRYTKADGSIDSIAPTVIHAYPSLGIALAVSGDVYKVTAYAFTESVTFEISQGASSLTAVPDSLGRDYLATLAPDGAAAEYSSVAATAGVAYIVGNFTDNNYYAEWSSDSSLIATAQVENSFVFAGVTLRKYDEFRVAGLGMTSSSLVFAERDGVYNIVYEKTGAVRLIESKPLAATFVGTVYKGKLPKATDFAVTYDSAAIPLPASDYVVMASAAQVGNNTAVIVYLDGGAIAKVNFTGTEDAVASVVCDTMPDKLDYYVGDAFVASGAEFTVTYLSGDSVTVLAGADGLSFSVASGYDNDAFTTRGGKSVTFVYGGVSSAAVTVNVYDKLDSIEVTTAPKQSYVAGAGTTELDLTGMVVKAFYNGATSGTIVAVTADGVSHNIDFDTIGEYTVTVTFTDSANNNQVKTSTFKVNVVAPQVIAIAVSGAPDKDTYFVGDTFMPEGLVFTATLDSGKTQQIAASDPKLGFNGGAAFTVSGSGVAVAVTYEVSDGNIITATGDVTVTVNDKLTSITATAPTAPHAAGFVAGDTVTEVGMTVTAFYNGLTDGGKAVTSFTTNVADIDTSSAGTKTITVTYTENGITKTTAVDITVLAKAAVGIVVDGTPVQQSMGATLKTAGLTFTVVYNNDEREEISVGELAFACEDYFTAGDVFATTGDTEYTATVTVALASAPTVMLGSFDVTVKNTGEYTIEFVCGNGEYVVTGTPEEEGVKFNNLIPEPIDPVSKGFAFGGWYKDSAFVTAWDFASDVVKGNMTLYGKWVANDYVVNFYQESGMVISGANFKATDGVFGTLDLMTVTPDAKDHYNFVGWYIDGVEPQTTLTALDYAALPESGTIINLKPVYEKVKYTVTFVYGNGEPDGEIQVEYGDAVQEPVEPTREHYTFDHWYEADIEASFDFGTAITENMTLTAHWTAVRYTVSYNASGLTDNTAFANGGNPDEYTADDGEVLLNFATTGEFGKAFSKWTDASGNTVTALSTALVDNGTITLTAVFVDADTFTVTFNSDGGTPVADIIAISGQAITEPTAPAKTGHTFMGWFADGASTKFDFENTPITEDITLTAHWSINSYEVTFVTDGGSAVNAQTVEYGALVQEPEAPTKEGFDFAGWYKEEACVNAWDFGADTVTGDTAIYAKWTVSEYTVSFDLMYEDAPAIEDQTVTHGGTITEPEKPVREDYEFIGWFSDRALQHDWKFDNAVTGPMTLYAKWLMLTNKFMFVNDEKEVRMYDNTDHNTDAKVKEEYTLMGIALEAGDVLTFNTKEGGDYSAITIVFDTYSKGVTFADNALTTKSAGNFDIYLKLMTSGEWKVYAEGGALLDGDYYAVGSFNEWTAGDEYLLNHADGAITLNIAKNATFKIVHGDAWLGYYIDGTSDSRVKAGGEYVKGDGENNFQMLAYGKYKLVFDGKYLSIEKVGEYEGEVEKEPVLSGKSAVFKFKDATIVIEIASTPSWMTKDTEFAYIWNDTLKGVQYKLDGASSYTIDANLADCNILVGFEQNSQWKKTDDLAGTEFENGMVHVIDAGAKADGSMSWVTGKDGVFEHTTSKSEIVYA